MSNKIGLCLAFKGTNYGALLQAFATQKTVENMGFQTEIIDYSPGNSKVTISSPEAYFSRIIEKIHRVKNKQKTSVLDEIHKENKERRVRAAEDFRHNELHNIIRIDGYDNLVEHSRQYKAVIVGSDQLWPPTVAFTYFRTLRFVPENVRKISYATSTGVSTYPWYVKRNAAEFMNSIDFLSVREETGREIVKNVCNRDAKVVLDPTYLFTKKEWEELIPYERIVDAGYVFSFFLGDNPEMKKLARQYADKRGLRIVAILSNEANADDSYADEVLIGQRPDQFINLIRNSECVFTDSFHGFAFSIINEKQVYISYRVRKGTPSRNSRIDNIVRAFGIENRLIINTATFLSKMDDMIDYTLVNQRLSTLRKDSCDFLKTALTFSENNEEESARLYDEKVECCGCEACANVCPKGIIEMQADEEGFYYPRVTDISKCIHCENCKNVCPVVHADQISSSFTEAYAGWAKDEETIITSSSGGFAATLTKAFLNRGGLVYGAAYTSDFSSVHYTRVTSTDQAEKLKTSKYIQARKHNVYQQIREDLRTKKVLFTGLPCEVYALKRFIKDSKNLYTLSIICHGPTSEKIHKCYLESIKKEIESPFKTFSVRFKRNGQWKPYYIRAVGKNDKEYTKQFDLSDYNTAFLYFKRPACGDCRFKNDHYAADILVGDYHAASKESSNWNEHGVSSILPLSDRGIEMMHLVDDAFVSSAVPLITAISQRAVHSSVIKKTNRNEFTRVLDSEGLHQACQIPSVKRDMEKTRAAKKRKYFKKEIKRIIKVLVRR